jgi:hypothetical protein
MFWNDDAEPLANSTAADIRSDAEDVIGQLFNIGGIIACESPDPLPGIPPSETDDCW